VADEWSKPVKDGDGHWRSETVGAPMGHYHAALLADGMIGEANDRVTAIPAHVALRLLAAEASDRLGLAWYLTPDFTGSHCKVGEWQLRTDGAITFEPGVCETPDQLLAALHGRFLLEDAMREGA